MSRDLKEERHSHVAIWGKKVLVRQDSERSWRSDCLRVFEEQQSGLYGRSPTSKVNSIPKTSEVGDQRPLRAFEPFWRDLSREVTHF